MNFRNLPMTVIVSSPSIILLVWTKITSFCWGWKCYRSGKKFNFYFIMSSVTMLWFPFYLDSIILSRSPTFINKILIKWWKIINSLQFFWKRFNHNIYTNLKSFDRCLRISKLVGIVWVQCLSTSHIVLLYTLEWINIFNVLIWIS